MAAVAKSRSKKPPLHLTSCFPTPGPEKFLPAVRRGVRVLVPFGRGNRLVQGDGLLGRRRKTPAHLKEVVSVLDPEPLLDENAFGIVEFMADTTFCTYYDAVRCLIPAGLSVTARESFALAHAPDRGDSPESAGR